MATITRAKDLLNKNIELSVGDIVTTDDDNETVEAYIIKDIIDSKAVICGLRVTEEKDDIIIDEIDADISSLIYIGEPFINMNGFLWKVRERILSGNPDISPI